MSKAIIVRAHGGPDVLQLEAIAVGAPATEQIRIRQTAIGVNFHDVYVRSGLYDTLTLPGIPGVEAVGLVEAVGSRVTHVMPGDRIGYVSAAYGAYAGERLIAADAAIRLPEDIDDRTAAAVLVKGLTACMLVGGVRTIRSGETCLVHAAAGGVGRMLCQWARHLGASVIGTVGSEEKAALARSSGCEHVILYRRENFAQRVLEITEGRGADAVYDSVGADTFSQSLEALAVRGHLINFGQSSGPIEPFAVSRLAAKSNLLSRPVVFHYLEARAEREMMAAKVFQSVRDGIISAEIGAEYGLSDAAEAHRALESRTTHGATILIP